MLEANKSLAKEIARLEGVEKTLKTTLMKRERTIKEKDRAFESLQDENAALVAKVEKQKRQLDNW
jgi:cell division protein FtsB